LKTIGQLLKQARIAKKKSLDQVSLETKIPQATLTLLEADDFGRLPAAPHVKGFIRNYAQAIGLDPDKALAIFRRDLVAIQSGAIVPKGLSRPLDNQDDLPKRLAVMVVVGAVLVLFLGYLGWQLKGYLAPPELTVTQPQPAAILKGPTVEVKGWVSADSSVWVNETLAEVLPNGQFKASISLLPGENTLQVRAENRRGKETIEDLTVEVVDK
jgi:cytoskeletal protein RodZ